MLSKNVNKYHEIFRFLFFLKSRIFWSTLYNIRNQIFGFDWDFDHATCPHKKVSSKWRYGSGQQDFSFETWSSLQTGFLFETLALELVSKMDALRYHPSLKSISLDQNVQVPQIESEDDVIVEVAYAGLCGTDIHIMQVSYRRFFSQFTDLKF